MVKFFQFTGSLEQFAEHFIEGKCMLIKFFTFSQTNL